MTSSIDPIVAGLSNIDAAALGSGDSFWYSKEIADIPAVNLTDGPHGLRKQAGSADHLGLAQAIPATCFPPAVALSQTWDVELVNRVGVALGEESQTEGVGVLLGPGINIKRDPRCGRNFEYFSEDPVLAGDLGTAWVSGVQSQGVGTSLKHFAANNQEADRMRVSANIDERTLRELYLRPFQKVVEAAQPWTVMCSYNKINGTYASEHPWLLTDVLRGEWGFEGYVVSDWGAVNDRVAAVKAGLDLQMPADGGAADAALVKAIDLGEIDRETVDIAASRVARISRRVRDSRREGFQYDVEAHHQVARDAAAASIVLLKNDRSILPLKAGANLAVIGEFAKAPRIQGAGSSHVNAQKLDVALDEIRAIFGDEVAYAQGYSTTKPETSPSFYEEAVSAAGAADVAVVLMGLGERQESEGFDREDIEIPADQLALLEQIAAVQKNIVVVLTHGAVLRLAGIVDLAPAILDASLLGQGGGWAVAQILSGGVNPSGKLAETVPVRLQDVPAWGNFPGEHQNVSYGEGLFVGYKWYENRDIAVTFPFGHGLSYTSFEYSDLVVDAGADTFEARVTVTNTGAVEGREVVQLYVSVPGSKVGRPVKELKAFGVAHVAPGESAEVVLTPASSDLAYWDIARDRWIVEGGTYVVSVGASSADIRVTAQVELVGTDSMLPLHMDSSMAEVLAHPIAGPAFGQMLHDTVGGLMGGDADAMDDLGVDGMAMLGSIPISRMLAMSPVAIDPAAIEMFFAAANRGEVPDLAGLMG